MWTEEEKRFLESDPLQGWSGNQSALVQRPEAQAGALANGPLVAPDPYSAPYAEDQMLNPRRQMWASMLGNWGQHVASGGKMGLGDAGMGAFNRAQMMNQRMKGANTAAKRQAWQDQNAHITGNQQYAQNEQQMAAGALGLEQAQKASELGIVPGAGQSYNDWVLAGSPGEYSDWVEKQRAQLRRTSAPAAVREWQHFQGLAPEQQDQYLRMKRGAKSYDVGGQNVFIDANGNAQVLGGEGLKQLTPEELIQTASASGESEGVESGTKKTEESWASDAQATIKSAQVIPEMIDKADTIDLMAQQLDSGEWGQGTGPLQGWLAKTNPETARIEMQSIRAALDELKTAGLQPVSDTEFKTLQGLWADPFSTPEVNAAKLRDISAKIRRDMEKLRNRQQWVGKHGDLRGFNLGGGPQAGTPYAPPAGASQAQPGPPQLPEIPGVTWE